MGWAFMGEPSASPRRCSRFLSRGSAPVHVPLSCDVPAGFRTPPALPHLASLGGEREHRLTTGATSIYAPTSGRSYASFRPCPSSARTCA